MLYCCFTVAFTSKLLLSQGTGLRRLASSACPAKTKALIKKKTLFVFLLASLLPEACLISLACKKKNLCLKKGSILFFFEAAAPEALASSAWRAKQAAVCKARACLLLNKYSSSNAAVTQQ
jgi:hypothetical protein